jgi:hypothetical protein
MAKTRSTSITRRGVVAGLALSAAPVALAQADKAHAQAAAQPSAEKSLYDRLGGVFAIAAVVDHFSLESSAIHKLGRPITPSFGGRATWGGGWAECRLLTQADLAAGRWLSFYRTVELRGLKLLSASFRRWPKVRKDWSDGLACR